MFDNEILDDFDSNSKFDISARCINKEWKNSGMEFISNSIPWKFRREITDFDKIANL